MARRGSRRRHSAREWSWRIALSLLIIAVGYFSIARTLSQALRTGDIERAHHLAPGDGQVGAGFAYSLITADAGPVNMALATQAAQVALRQDPTAIAALSTLGIVAQNKGNPGAARRLFKYAEILSRRDLQVQLWAIEDSVRRNNIAGALIHYDIALRTSRNAWALLVPVLGSAIANPPVRAALTQTLSEYPVWGPHFINYVVGEGEDLPAVAHLLTDMHRAQLTVSPTAQTALINKLLMSGLTNEAWSYYSLVNTGTDRRRSRDPNFRGSSESPSLFDWTPSADADIATNFGSFEKGKGLEFSLPSGTGGQILRQMQLLPLGRYRLEGRSAAINQVERSRPYWVLACQDGRELGRVILPNSSAAESVFGGEFQVPTTCPVQTLSLVARPSDAVAGVSGEIYQALLHPVR